MIGKSLVGSILILAAGAAAFAQDVALEELLPSLKGKAVVIDMVTRVVEGGKEEIWNQSSSKVTLPGRPVSLKLVGENIVIALQFTPYFRRDGNTILVAQGQIWILVAGEGMSYFTTMQTIPLGFGEEVFFFPLGQKMPQDDALIEIQLALRPYAGDEETTVPGSP